MLLLQTNILTMAEFDRLVQSAAIKKREDIINRYGHEGCARLLAKAKRKGTNNESYDPEFIKENNNKSMTFLFWRRNSKKEAASPASGRRIKGSHSL
jgi:hypothetical protein